MVIEVDRCDSAVGADEIKALFVRNERPTFPTCFQRAYSYAASTGGLRWIARAAQGTIIGHLAAFPRMFRTAARVTRAALLVDLLFDAAHRNFWAAVELLRRAVADLTEAGDFDFAYSDPTPPGAVILKAAGFTTVDTLERFVVPLNRLYLKGFRIVSRVAPLSIERLGDREEQRLVDALNTLPQGRCFRGHRSLESYRTRLGGDTIPEWEWLLLRPYPEPAATVVAVGLTGGPRSGKTQSLFDVIWDEGRVSPASVAHAIARTATDDRHQRLATWTLGQSAFARALRRCGFIARRDGLPVYCRVVREGGVLPSSGDWLLTYFDGSAW